MKKLFLCHYNEDAGDVLVLARELRLRGIKPWVDQHGGFLLGDSTAAAARLALTEECFGLVFYATREAFSRPFIRTVEIDQAVRIKESDPNYLLVAVLRDLTFGELADLTRSQFGVNLASFHSVGVISEGGDATYLRNQMAGVAKEVLIRALRLEASVIRGRGAADVQFATREMVASNPEEVLCIDATQLVNQVPPDPASWRGVLEGLLDVKNAVSGQIGRPRLRVTGYRHLTAAFILGWTFSEPSGYAVEVQQAGQYWRSDCLATDLIPFDAAVADGAVASDTLFVEVTATDKLVRDAVRRHVQTTGLEPHIYLRFVPKVGPQPDAVPDNTTACAMARQIRTSIAETLRQYPVRMIHLFGAMPHSLMTFVGHQLNAMPPIQLYEYDGQQYFPSCLVH